MISLRSEEPQCVKAFLGKMVTTDFMSFITDFITGCLKESGSDGIEVAEREPYPGVGYPGQRVHAFAKKPIP